MFRVTNDQQAGVGVTLRLEGRLTAAWVDEFAKELDGAMRGGAVVTLDLDGLAYADHRGVAIIRGGLERGARCVGGSEFIGALIQEERPR